MPGNRQGVIPDLDTMLPEGAVVLQSSTEYIRERDVYTYSARYRLNGEIAEKTVEISMQDILNL